MNVLGFVLGSFLSPNILMSFYIPAVILNKSPKQHLVVLQRVLGKIEKFQHNKKLCVKM